MGKIILIIESARDGELWGRVQYQDNLIIANANDEASLQAAMKKQLYTFHKLKPTEIVFDIQHDISGFFEHKHYLNVSAVASLAGINPSLMRQYVAGIKNPGLDRLKSIEKAIHSIGKEMQRIKLAPKY